MPKNQGNAQTGLPPAAFLSYAHVGGIAEEIERLREHLSDAIALHVGEEFPIFQDREDIHWGQNWKRRIDDSIDAATFFIPILTPAFFRRTHCRQEAARFLDHERAIGRDDLVLPILWTRCPLIEDEATLRGDEIAKAILEHQYDDWRWLRLLPFEAPEVKSALARLGEQVQDALARQAAPVPPVRSPQRSPLGGAKGLKAPLSPRETAVLALLATGASTAEIAEALSTTRYTVRAHTLRVLDKLGVQNRIEAVRLAIRMGLVGP